MKKLVSILLSAILSLGASLGLGGCTNEQFDYIYVPNEYYAVVADTLGNEYKIDVTAKKDLSEQVLEYDLEFFARNNALWTVELQGLYEKDGTPISSELYISQFGSTEVIDLSIVDERVMEKSCDILYWIKGDRRNGTKRREYRLTFQFNVTVKPDKTMHQYVTIRDAEIPYGYFACDMQEVYADNYELNAFRDMIGVDNTNSFEYGHLYKHFSSEGAVLNYSSIIRQQQTKDEVVFGIEMYHDFNPNAKYGWEAYHYEQLHGTGGYYLQEMDGIFASGVYTGRKPGVADSAWSNYKSNRLDVVKKGTDLVYRAGEKDGYLYISITGILQDFFHSKPTIVTATYKTQDNKIVAWLYEEYCPSYEQGGEYWRTTHYCIPLEGEIELLDEELLNSVCKSKGK